MGSTIEFNRFVIKSEPKGQFNDALYFGFSEYGESNVRDEMGRIPRHITMVALDRDYQFMQRIVEMSTNCESGMLKLNGRRTNPEGFIAAWRKARKGALFLSNYLDFANLELSFRSLVRAIETKRASLDLSNRWHQQMARELNDLIIRICTTAGVDECIETWFDEAIPVTRFTVTRQNMNDMLALLADIRERVPLKQFWRTVFSQYGWERGLVQQTRLRSEPTPALQKGVA